VNWKPASVLLSAKFLVKGINDIFILTFSVDAH
jgi:hypothetical protein